MPPKILQARPSARLLEAMSAWRICCNASYAGLDEDPGGGSRRPGGVPRLAHHVRINGSRERNNARSWVMAFGSFTANRKPGGTEAAHRS